MPESSNFVGSPTVMILLSLFQGVSVGGGGILSASRSAFVERKDLFVITKPALIMSTNPNIAVNIFMRIPNLLRVNGCIPCLTLLIN